MRHVVYLALGVLAFAQQEGSNPQAQTTSSPLTEAQNLRLQVIALTSENAELRRIIADANLQILTLQACGTDPNCRVDQKSGTVVRLVPEKPKEDKKK